MRIRTIKPDFYRDALTGEWDATRALFYVGIWSVADDQGRLALDPRLVRADLDPFDTKFGGIQGVADLLQELVRLRRLLPYEVDGRRFAVVGKFKDHQVINKPTKSRLPPPPEGLREDSGSPTVALPPEVGAEGKGEEGKGEEGNLAAAPAPDEEKAPRGGDQPPVPATELMQPEPPAPIDDFPVRPLLTMDLNELGPLAAELRGLLERRAEWKFLVAAHDRKAEVRTSLEASCAALGVERAEQLCQAVLDRRRKQGLQPPKAMAFFAPMLEEAAKGGDPMPSGEAETEADQVRRRLDAEVEARWAPLLARMSDEQRQAYEAEKARMADAIRSQGCWASEEWRQFNEAEAFLFAKWSRKVPTAQEVA